MPICRAKLHNLFGKSYWKILCSLSRHIGLYYLKNLNAYKRFGSSSKCLISPFCATPSIWHEWKERLALFATWWGYSRPFVQTGSKLGLQHYTKKLFLFFFVNWTGVKKTNYWYSPEKKRLTLRTPPASTDLTYIRTILNMCELGYFIFFWLFYSLNWSPYFFLFFLFFYRTRLAVRSVGDLIKNQNPPFSLANIWNPIQPIRTRKTPQVRGKKNYLIKKRQLANIYHWGRTFANKIFSFLKIKKIFCFLFMRSCAPFRVPTILW